MEGEQAPRQKQSEAISNHQQHLRSMTWRVSKQLEASAGASVAGPMKTCSSQQAADKQQKAPGKRQARSR